MFGALTRKLPPIGLDISIDGARMMQLDAIGKAVSVIAAARRRFPVTVIDDPQLFRDHAVRSVKEMLSEGGFRGRRVVTCLNSREMDVKQARMPRIPERERAAAVRWEANERFEFDVRPELLHHLTAGEVRSGSEAHDEVIMLAAPEQLVDSHVSLLEAMDLYPAALDAEPACVFRPFERFLRRGADATKISVVVDIRPDNTWVILSAGRNISFLKSVDVGDIHFSKAVSEQLSIDLSEAVQLRRQMAADADAADADAAEEAVDAEPIHRAVHDAIRPVAEELAREISLCLRYCAVTFRGARPARVTLVGVGVADPHVRDLIDKSMNLDCETGRPLRGVDLSQVELGSDHRGPSCEWSVAAGLALRELMATEDRRERKHDSDRLSA